MHRPGNVRAAELCKIDLTTELVKEFTELQGVVGGLYARAQGEPEPVWQAIYDQYKPESMEDQIPRNRTGQIVGLADRLDTLRGCFAIGLIPSGSRDPFALRRAQSGGNGRNLGRVGPMHLTSYRAGRGVEDDADTRQIRCGGGGLRGSHGGYVSRIL